MRRRIWGGHLPGELRVIEQVLILGLKLAIYEGQELSTGHLLAAVPEVRPLSQTDRERVAAITAGLNGHAKRTSAHGS